MTILDLKLKLPDNLLNQLQSEAEARKVPVDQVVIEALVDYFDELPDTPDEEILDHLETSMRQALAGNYRPAREVMEEIKRDLGIETPRE